MEACYRRAKLIEGVFERGIELRSDLSDIRREERVDRLVKEALK